MEQDVIWLLLSVFVAGYGIYSVIGSFKMKNECIPPAGLIRNEDILGARDIRGFCQAMAKPYIIFGFLLIISGGISVANYFLILGAAFELVSMIILAAAIVFLVVVNARLRNQFIK